MATITVTTCCFFLVPLFSVSLSVSAFSFSLWCDIFSIAHLFLSKEREWISAPVFRELFNILCRVFSRREGGQQHFNTSKIIV